MLVNPMDTEVAAVARLLLKLHMVVVVVRLSLFKTAVMASQAGEVSCFFERVLH